MLVVFIVSNKSDTGPNLNYVLLEGSTIQEDLRNILVRFRTYKYAVSADISKMYRQIKVIPKHREYQKLLWRADNEQPLQINSDL